MNAIVIVCDCLPIGFLGAYGSDWVETPHLDRLAHDGYVFDYCLPNRPETGVWRSVGWSGKADFFESAIRSDSSQRLADAGVARAFFSDHAELRVRSDDFDHVAHTPEPTIASADLPPIDRVLEHPEYHVPDLAIPEKDAWLTRWRRQLALEDRGTEPSPFTVFSRAGDWILERSASEPFLAWIEIATAENLWTPRLELRDQYREPDAEIGYVRDPMPGLLGQTLPENLLSAAQSFWASRLAVLDEAVGVFLDRMRSTGIYENSLVFFTAEQGLPFGQHGILGPIDPWIYEERSHVPLFLRNPQGRSAGRSPALVQATDLRPTLLDAFGIPEKFSPGCDLLPLTRGEHVQIRDYACFGLDDAIYAIQTRQWKLIVPVASIAGYESPRRELFAKPEDRWDVRDLADESAEVADRLELQLRRYLDAVRRNSFDLLAPAPDLDAG